jgi:excinuclease ABC subunit B
MYADRMSDAMKEAIAETNHRRSVQMAYNKEHGITPATIKKAINDILERHETEDHDAALQSIEALEKSANMTSAADRKKLIKALEAEMLEHAKKLEYESAAAIRDEIEKIKSVGKI